MKMKIRRRVRHLTCPTGENARLLPMGINKIGNVIDRMVAESYPDAPGIGN